jgi:hypothetical protein
LLAEGDATVTASALSVDTLRLLAAEVERLGWQHWVSDAENNEWGVGEARQEYAPFRLSIAKPGVVDGTLRLLTIEGLVRNLQESRVEAHWEIARLHLPFSTELVQFTPWGSLCDFVPGADKKSPRSLVREVGAERLVPLDVRQWLLRGSSKGLMENVAFRVWGSEAARNLLFALADEVDSEDSSLKFRGPPKLTISALPAPDNDLLSELTPAGFEAVQEAASWVFENNREAEMRHVLLATEIARGGGGATSAPKFLGREMSVALEGAKIAYQMALSELSRDTLKALGELRKAVTDETAKVTDAARQITAAVATALAIGLGLLAARTTTAVNPLLLKGVMLVALVYVAAIVISGRQFILLQRRLRQDWQPRLYRFLPQAEYKQMVGDPMKRAEGAFAWGAGLGSLAVIGLALAVFFFPIQTGTVGPEPSNKTTLTETPTPVEAPQSGARPPPPPPQAPQLPASKK